MRENQKLITDIPHSSMESDCIKILERENRMLKQTMEHLRQENENLRNRGAGRKPSQERLDAIGRMQELLNAGYNEQDIMSELGISRPTYYRYKKNLRN